MLSEAMDKGLFHPRCRHGLSTYYPEIDEIDREYDSYVERDVTDYGEHNQAYVENMIQKYKRLSRGCIDPENVAKYEAKLKEWEGKLTSFDVAKSENGGIIETGSDDMGISIEIDKFTPCLVEKSTGKIIQTKYAIAEQSELKGFKRSGWSFNWNSEDLEKATVFKLQIDDDSIQGLIAITDFPRSNALYVNLAESAPHNKGIDKMYEGVGGHLFAIAANESVKKGYGGFLFLDAKNKELVKYYSEKFGATLVGMPHPYRMFIDEENASKLLKIYTLKGD